MIVSGEDGFREAKEFMRLLMPSHAKNVQFWREPQALFAKAGAESQLDAMFSNVVTLKSGGYIVINQTEALVAIDVNSGRSTREHNIEDTALRTNLEAADEVARQLRLRDLAGLIVVDFIDMEEGRNNRAVERRIKDALKNDRARIQVGRISHFGLLEMSRQRIRTGVLEGSTIVCPHCAGSGSVRSTASIALHVMRVLEDALVKNAMHNITVRTRTYVALYILNQKRAHLRALEERFGVQITVEADDTLTGTVYHALERGELASPPVSYEKKELVRIDSIPMEDEEIEDEVEEEEDEDSEDGEERADGEARGEGEDGEGRGRRRRRRRRRGRGGDRDRSFVDPDAPQPSDDGLHVVAEIGGDITRRADDGDGEVDTTEAESFDADGNPVEGDPMRRRRRSRRGGRNRRRDGFERREREDAPRAEFGEPDAAESASASPVAPAPEAPVAPAWDWAPIAASAEDKPAETKASMPVAHAPEPPQAEEPAPAPRAEPLPEAPVGPKRSGWWSRAKQSFGGN